MSQRDRRLSLAERDKQILFNEYNKKMNKNGFNKKEVVLPLKKANILGPIIGAILSAPFIAVFFLLTGNEALNKGEHFSRNYIIFFVLIVATLAIREIIRGVTWGLFTKEKLKSVEFRIMGQLLNPYCTCKESLKKAYYITGLLMPFIILGIIPSVVSLFVKNVWFLWMGVAMTLSAGIDILIAFSAIRNKTQREALYHDHPINIGYVVYEKKQGKDNEDSKEKQ